MTYPTQSGRIRAPRSEIQLTLVAYNFDITKIIAETVETAAMVPGKDRR